MLSDRFIEMWILVKRLVHRFQVPHSTMEKGYARYFLRDKIRNDIIHQRTKMMDTAHKRKENVEMAAYA